MSNADEAPVAQLLADELERQGVGKRELARKLAGNGDHARIEKERRAVYKVLNGTQPMPPFARRLAKALDLDDEDYFVREVKRTSAAERVAALERELEEARAEIQRLRHRTQP